MGRVWRIVKPRRADWALVLAGLYLIGCAVIPSTILIDWEIVPTSYDDLAGPVSVSIISAAAGLANAFAAWLIFGRAKIAIRVALTVVLGFLTTGFYWFGVRCAAFDPWHCPETSMLRRLPVIWIISLLSFAFAGFLRQAANKLNKPKLNKLGSRPKSPVVWLGIPIAIVLWLAHIVAQSGLMAGGTYAGEAYHSLRTVATAILSLVIAPAAILVLVTNRFARSCLLVAYFSLVSFLGILMEFRGQFEASFFYGVAFLGGLFFSRWYGDLWGLSANATSGADVRSSRAVGPYSLTACAVAVTGTAFCGWFLTRYDLTSLTAARSPQRWLIAELNRGWDKAIAVSRSRDRFFDFEFDPNARVLFIDQKPTERERDIIAQLSPNLVYLNSLGPRDFAALPNFATSLVGLCIRNCQLDAKMLRDALTSTKPLRVSFIDCSFADGALMELVDKSRPSEIRFYNCGHLWQQIFTLPVLPQAKTIYYDGPDIVPVEQILLGRNSNILIVQQYDDAGLAISKLEPEGHVAWKKCAQRIERNSSGDIVVLDITGIKLDNDLVQAIGENANIAWLGITANAMNWHLAPEGKQVGFMGIPYDYSPLGSLSRLRHIRLEAMDSGASPYQGDTIPENKSVLAVLSSIPSIETIEIDLASTQVRELFLKDLVKFQHLRKLTLKSNEFEPRDLRPLLQIPKLQELVIGSPNKDLGADDDWRALMLLAPRITLRREKVSRYEWPVGGDLWNPQK